jgi:hypothetical protein
MTIGAGNKVRAQDGVELDRVTTTTSSTAASAETVVQTITVDVVAGQEYKIYAKGLCQANTVADRMRYLLREDSVSGTTLDLGNIYQDATGDALSFRAEAYWTASSTGAKTFVQTLGRYAGSGTCQLVAGATYPAWIVVTAVR